MTDDNLIERIVGDESRRDFMKKSAVAAVGAGAAASGTAAAQEGGDSVGGEGWKALVPVSQFKPQAQFSIVSPVVEWVPNYGEINSSLFSNYQTRMIRYQNSGETVPIYVAQDAPIGQFDQELGFVADADDDVNQPQLYEMDKEWTPLGDNPTLVTVNVSTVPEEEEDAILENDEWWQDGGEPGVISGDGGA